MATEPKRYRVVFEIDDENYSALEAAKNVQNLIKSGGDYQWYVQDVETNEIFSVDLEEEDEDAVLPVEKYEEFIVNAPLYKDCNGNVLGIGDNVQVPEPNETDLHQNEFVGYISNLSNGFACVRDCDDDFFNIEPERLKLV
ncbi:MAG: hypothetical protein HGA35_04390 [Erysipelotrichaceae bacterium]|nr:hypothetical protein [Erysipelotrichaceae bacterium]